MKSEQIFRVAIVALIAAFVIILMLAGFLGDWFWFTTVGYENVFLTIVVTRLILGIIAFVAFFGFSYA